MHESAAFSDRLSCLSPPLLAGESGSGLSSWEMFKTQVLKCGEIVGGGCLGGLCGGQREFLSAHNCAQKHRFSTHFPVGNSAGLGGWGWREEGGGGGGNQGKKTETEG